LFLVWSFNTLNNFIFPCFTIFDLLNLPDRGSPEFKTYGSPSLKKLANHFVQSDTEEDKQMKEEKMTAEWGHLKYLPERLFPILPIIIIKKKINPD
jgi:hypothetical protein